jgi:hypothetical protein
VRSKPGCCATLASLARTATGLPSVGLGLAVLARGAGPPGERAGDPPELFPAFFGFFGQLGGQLLKKAAGKHIEDNLGKALDKASALGQKSAFEEAMERAYGGWLEAMLKYLDALGYDA